jgi:hypothetical protein
MKKLTRIEMKNVIGGKRAFASCGVECADGLIHNYNCGSYACNTTTNAQVQCSDTNGTVVSTNNPCSAN